MPKKRKAPAASRLTTSTTEAPMRVSRPKTEIEIPHDEIARAAYARFQARGRAPGFALEDWLTAEAELRAAQS